MNDDPGTARTPEPGGAAGPARGAGDNADRPEPADREEPPEHRAHAERRRTHSKVVAVVVTHRRAELLAESLAVVTAQTRTVDHVIVVDNGDEERVRDLVDSQPVETTYLGSKTNLGGAGGFALGMLHALALGADWVWCADDDGRPEGPAVLATLLECADHHRLDEVSPVVCDIEDPERLAFPLRRGLVWRRHRSELLGDTDSETGSDVDGLAAADDGGTGGSRVVGAVKGGDSSRPDLLPGIASLFNGALFSAHSLEKIGVPDLRLFVRGDEVEMHRRLVRSGLRFGTCLTTAYLHPNGSAEFKPILGGRMHTQFPDDPIKRHFTYRNRGYLLSQPGLRKLIPQELVRFGWFFLVDRKDPAAFREWLRLQRMGSSERFDKP